MRKIIFILMLIFVVLIPTGCNQSVQAQQDYFVLMLICGSRYDSSNLHVGQLGSEAAAKQWADTEMQGRWDIAYIYDSWTTDGSMRLLWARSESDCYPDMREWRRFD